MNLFEFDGKRPQIHPDAWVAPTATLIGDVRIGADASVWYGAVLRADVGPITLGERSNIQDNSVLHARYGSALTIGSGSTIAHGCVMHGDEVGDGTLIGNASTVLDGCVIGSGCLVAAGAVVTPGTTIPDGRLVVGVPAKIRGPIEPGSNAAAILARNADGYVQLKDVHRVSVRPVSPTDS